MVGGQSPGWRPPFSGYRAGVIGNASHNNHQSLNLDSYPLKSTSSETESQFCGL